MKHFFKTNANDNLVISSNDLFYLTRLIEQAEVDKIALDHLDSTKFINKKLRNFNRFNNDLQIVATMNHLCFSITKALTLEESIFAYYDLNSGNLEKVHDYESMFLKTQIEENCILVCTRPISMKQSLKVFMPISWINANILFITKNDNEYKITAKDSDSEIILYDYDFKSFIDNLENSELVNFDSKCRIFEQIGDINNV